MEQGMAKHIEDHPQIREAWVQYGKENYGKAQTLCQGLVDDASPAAPNAWLIIALCELANGKPDAAEDALDNIADLLPMKVPTAIVQGQIALAREQFAEAKISFSVALDFQPDSIDALYGLGQAQHGLGDASAREPLRRVVNLQAKHAAAQFLLGVVALEAEDSAEAIAAFGAASRLLPKSAEVANNLGLAHQAAGEPKRAEKNYRNAISLSPDFAQAWFNLAATLGTCDNLMEAQRCYDQALTLDPSLSEHGKPWTTSTATDA
jgi:tetratricopeptide (TPR) repeat protein